MRQATSPSTAASNCSPKVPASCSRFVTEAGKLERSAAQGKAPCRLIAAAAAVDDAQLGGT